MTQEVKFSVSLPPRVLRSNSRAHWWSKAVAKQEYSREVYSDATGYGFLDWTMGYPWKAADVSYEWHYCGTAPDEGNLGQNLKALQDILCMAPDTGLQKNNTTYLGLVENDKHITPTYSMVKEARRAAERVEVVVRRREAP